MNKASADLITPGQMPCALRGYSCPMKQVAKTMSLILLVPLLSSCSSSSESVDKPQAKTQCETVKEKALEMGKKAANESSPQATRQQDYLIFFNYIIEEGNCFESEEVAQARSGIAILLAAIAKQ